MNHIGEGDLLKLADGGIAPNQSVALHAHLSECSVCQKEWLSVKELVSDLSAPLSFDEEAHVNSILSKLDSAVGLPPRRKKRFPVLPVGAGAVVLALAAGFVLIPKSPQPEFMSRGGASESSLSRDVGVAFSVTKSEGGERRVENGISVSPRAKYLAGVTNIHEAPSYFLSFAVDSKGAVHWLYPAYEKESDDPTSVRLPRSERALPMSTEVVLDSPAAGPLRLVTLVTNEPVRVKTLDVLPGSELTIAALSKRFAGSAAHEWILTVTP